MEKLDRYVARSIVMKSPQISRGARMLYMALDEHQRDGQDCWPHQRTLKEYVGCSSRSLQYYLAELVREKLVAVERVAAGGRNRYRLFHKDHAQPVALPHAMDCATHAQPVAHLKANRELKPRYPLNPPPSGGPHCEVCNDSPNRITVRRDGREAVRQWCPACGGKKRARTA